MTIIKILDFTAELDKKGSGYNVRIKIYATPKKKLSQLDTNSTAGIIAYVLPSGKRERRVETFLQLAGRSSWSESSISYLDPNTKSEKTLKVREMMI